MHIFFREYVCCNLSLCDIHIEIRAKRLITMEIPRVSKTIFCKNTGLNLFKVRVVCFSIVVNRFIGEVLILFLALET